MGLPIVVFGIGILMIAGIAVYLYRYLLRALELLQLERKNKGVKGIAAAGAAILLGVTARFMRGGSILAAHLLVIAWVLEGVNAIVKRTGRRKKKVWNVIFASGLLPVVLTTAILGYGYWNMAQVRETDYKVPTSKAIRKEGYRIAMISDLHYPTTMGEKQLAAYCEEIAKTNPDLVVLDGDIVDENTTYEEMQTAMRLLSGIPSVFGSYYVYGNHDMATYSSAPAFTKEQLATTITSTGIHIVEDAVVQVTEDLVLVGRADCGFNQEGNRKSMEELLSGVSMEDFILVLDHQPKELVGNKNAGVDLQLSGHTHAGQIFPGGLISELFGINEQNYGLRNNGDFTSIVSSGIAGWGSKFRTEGHSEYVVIDIMQQ